MPNHETVPHPVNDPRLVRLVRVKVVRSFRVGGRALAVGEEVEIPWHLHQDLHALGKCELNHECE